MCKKTVLGQLLWLCLLPASLIADQGLQFIAHDEARLLAQGAAVRRNYLVALGPYEKRDNRWQPEASVRLSGVLTRYTYEIPAVYDEQAVFAFYRQQLPEGGETLYECRRMHCGNSNNWANDHFRIKQLYGLDYHQFYGVYRLATGDTVTLYSVRRGNRRIYAHIDHLRPE
ncbi:MAG: DUF4892 domain-containing protein [Cellvibrionaceae bacterium]|nr:DUF4892 domain-containing protein [Cellvibrionaceae bacterium]